MLRLPQPPRTTDLSSRAPERARIADDLATCGLLKADADWDEKHPRTGTSPNPGWFATKPEDSQANPRSDTSSDPSQASAAGDGRPQIELVADNSELHNKLQDKLYKDYNSAGNFCVQEFSLTFAGVTARLDLFCKTADGELTGVEIKTGDTDYTENQKIVYPHAILGYGVVASDPRSSYFGVSSGQVLPPIDIILIYVGKDSEILRSYSLRDVMRGASK